MKRIVKFLSSIKLAIVLLIILAGASILGTLIPQGRTVEEYAARYGSLSGALIKLQWTTLYRSVWFMGRSRIGNGIRAGPARPDRR